MLDKVSKGGDAGAVVVAVRTGDKRKPLPVAIEGCPLHPTRSEAVPVHRRKGEFATKQKEFVVGWGIARTDERLDQDLWGNSGVGPFDQPPTIWTGQLAGDLPFDLRPIWIWPVDEMVAAAAMVALDDIGNRPPALRARWQVWPSVQCGRHPFVPELTGDDLLGLDLVCQQDHSGRTPLQLGNLHLLREACRIVQIGQATDGAQVVIPDHQPVHRLAHRFSCP